MKKIVFLLTVILLASMVRLVAQNYTVNPLPSYNFKMTDPQALFGELRGQLGNSREKRDMDVIISTTNHSPIPVVAKVWVVKNAGSVVMGPYFIVPNQLLTVGIDYGKWGVIVKCDSEVYVDVWID
jgi:hypothetical protein